MTYHELAERTSDAYSYDRYGASGWRGSARALLRAGFTPDDAEAILRSKLTRWAADMGGRRYGRASSRDLVAFLASDGGRKALRLVLDGGQ